MFLKRLLRVLTHSGTASCCARAVTHCTGLTLHRPEDTTLSPQPGWPGCGGQAELGGVCERGAEGREQNLSNIWELGGRGVEQMSGGLLRLCTHMPTRVHMCKPTQLSGDRAHFKVWRPTHTMPVCLQLTWGACGVSAFSRSRAWPAAAVSWCPGDGGSARARSLCLTLTPSLPITKTPSVSASPLPGDSACTCGAVGVRGCACVGGWQGRENSITFTEGQAGLGAATRGSSWDQRDLAVLRGALCSTALSRQAGASWCTSEGGGGPAGPQLSSRAEPRDTKPHAWTTATQSPPAPGSRGRLVPGPLSLSLSESPHR